MIHVRISNSGTFDRRISYISRSAGPIELSEEPSDSLSVLISHTKSSSDLFCRCRQGNMLGHVNSVARIYCTCSFVLRNRKSGHSSPVVLRCQALRARNTGEPLWSSAMAACWACENFLSAWWSGASTQRAV
jgi:hypothetical protein